MATQTLQPAFTGGELSPSLEGRVDFAKYSLSARKLENFIVQPHGGAARRPGFLLVDVLPGEAALYQFFFNTEQSFCLVFGDYWLRIATKDGFVQKEDGSGVYEAASPYSLEQAGALSMVQDADYMFIACRGMKPHTLQRHANDDWRFEEMSFDSPIDAPQKPTAVLVGGGTANTPYTYVVTAVTDDEEEGEASEAEKIDGPPASGWTVDQSIKLTWPEVAGAAYYKIYKASYNGTPGYAGRVEASFESTATWSDFNTQPTAGSNPPIYYDPFAPEDPANDDRSTYPAIAGMWQQRLVFAASAAAPLKIWVSRTGSYSSFGYHDPVQADDSAELTLAAKDMSPLRWLASLRTLVVGSDSIEWEIGSADTAFSAASPGGPVPKSYWGSSDVVGALESGYSILHVTQAENVIRDMRYEFGLDAFNGSDRSILATHLFEGHSIKSWAYQQTPESMVWAVRDDGMLLGMTYYPEEAINVIAWHRHTTQGSFRRVQTVRGERGYNLFAVVERDGAYSLEVMAPRYFSGDISRAVFMDSAVLKEYAEPVTEVTGLDFFEGKIVGILADGAVKPGQTVTGGRITLPGPASVVVIGLDYTCELETLPIEAINSSGATVTRKKTVSGLKVKFYNTSLARAGFGGRSKTVERKARSTEPYGTPPKVFTGTEEFVLTGGTGTDVTLRILGENPTPLTVLDLVPVVQFTS